MSWQKLLNIVTICCWEFRLCRKQSKESKANRNGSPRALSPSHKILLLKFSCLSSQHSQVYSLAMLVTRTINLNKSTPWRQPTRAWNVKDSVMWQSLGSGSPFRNDARMLMENEVLFPTVVLLPYKAVFVSSAILPSPSSLSPYLCCNEHRDLGPTAF